MCGVARIEKHLYFPSRPLGIRKLSRIVFESTQNPKAKRFY